MVQVTAILAHTWKVAVKSTRLERAQMLLRLPLPVPAAQVTIWVLVSKLRLTPF